MLLAYSYSIAIISNKCEGMTLQLLRFGGSHPIVQKVLIGHEQLSSIAGTS